MNLFSLFKPIAFQMDPEKVHDLSIQTFSSFPTLSTLLPTAVNDPRYAITDGHINWSFPVGLAAGFDKNAMAYDFFNRIGFGAVEIGTVTKQPQAGNEKPRIWRYPENNAIRNAMGFPNYGSEFVLNRLKLNKSQGCLGINIGKNKSTSEKDTPEEYADLYSMFVDYGDYLVINISSPNTPGLRSLQTKDSFKDICIAINERRKLNSKPLYLKVAPDINTDDLKDLIEVAKEFKLSGVIATNTTIQHDYDKGGLSGAPLKPIAKQIRDIACDICKEDKNFSVIGVGGIDSFEEILDFWNKGGSMVQIYSSFIFHGPKLLVDIQKDMNKFLQNNQLRSIQEYINSL